MSSNTASRSDGLRTAAASALLTLAGCSSPSTPVTEPERDSTPPDAIVEDSRSDSATEASIGAGCATLVNSGSIVAPEESSDKFEGSGGVIAVGTYRLTRFEVHGATTGVRSTRETLVVVDGGWMAEVQELIGGGKFRGDHAYATSGSKITLSVICGDDPALPGSLLQFTAGPDELLISWPGSVRLTYTRVP